MHNLSSEGCVEHQFDGRNTQQTLSVTCSCFSKHVHFLPAIWFNWNPLKPYKYCYVLFILRLYSVNFNVNALEGQNGRLNFFFFLVPSSEETPFLTTVMYWQGSPWLVLCGQVFTQTSFLINQTSCVFNYLMYIQMMPC